MTVATVFYILMLIAKIPSQSMQPSQERKKGWLDIGEIWNMCRRGYKAWEDSRADSVKCLEMYDKYFIGWLRKYKPPAGRKTRLRAWQLLMRSVKSAFALLLTKVTKPPYPVKVS